MGCAQHMNSKVFIYFKYSPEWVELLSKELNSGHLTQLSCHVQFILPLAHTLCPDQVSTICCTTLISFLSKIESLCGISSTTFAHTGRQNGPQYVWRRSGQEHKLIKDFMFFFSNNYLGRPSIALCDFASTVISLWCNYLQQNIF